MQLKTINKTIRKKMNEWIASITDESLRMKLEKNILVSGGSITSMLTNTDVNDYDVYIKDMNVLIEVANYYTKSFGSIDVLDGRSRQEYLDNYTNKRGKYADAEAEGNDAYYAVVLRTLKEDQVKLTFPSNTSGMRVNEDAKDEDKAKYIPVFFSPNAISLSNRVQIVLRFHGDDEKIHSTFDFIHATNYWTFDTGLVTNKKALESILTRQLMYQGSLYPLTTIIRIKKFLKRGWNINAGEMLKVMFQISELDLKNPDVLEEQLIGVDIAYFSKLIEILRGVDSNKLTSQYLNEIIDRVFSEFEDESDAQDAQ